MEVILLKNLDNVGDKYDVVKVKAGFGRNYLIPHRFAVVANKPNMAKLDDIKEKEAADIAKRLDEFQALAEQLKDKVLKVAAKAGESGKIFGSVTNIQVAQAMREQFDIDIERKKIELQEEIKTLGNYTAKVNFHPEVECIVNLEVFQD